MTWSNIVLCGAYLLDPVLHHPEQKEKKELLVRCGVLQNMQSVRADPRRCQQKVKSLPLQAAHRLGNDGAMDFILRSEKPKVSGFMPGLNHQ